MEIGEEISGDEEIRDLPAWKVENSNPEVSFGNSLTAKNSKHLTMFFKVKMNTEGGKKQNKTKPNKPPKPHTYKTRFWIYRLLQGIQGAYLTQFL